MSRWIEISARLEKIYRYFIRSHFHTKIISQTAVGENIVNASLKGGDEYAVGSALFSDPVQLLFGVHPKYGKTWELTINTRYAKGPVRYRWDRDAALVEQGELLALGAA